MGYKLVKKDCMLSKVAEYLPYIAVLIILTSGIINKKTLNKYNLNAIVKNPITKLVILGMIVYCFEHYKLISFALVILFFSLETAQYSSEIDETFIDVLRMKEAEHFIDTINASQ